MKKRCALVGICLFLHAIPAATQASTLLRTLATTCAVWALSGYQAGAGDSTLHMGRRRLADENTRYIQSFGGGYDDFGSGIEIKSEGNLLIAGATESPNDGATYSGLGIQLNTDGTIAYAKAFGEGTDSDYLYGISQTSDGGIALMGNERSSSLTFRSSVLAIKLFSDWTLQWAKSLRFVDNYAHYIYSGTSTGDGGIVMAGYYQYKTGGGYSYYRGLILKLDPNGDRVWSKYFYLDATNQEYIKSIIETNSGDIVIAGYHNTKAFIGKLNSGGGISWMKRISNWVYAQAVAELIDGSFGLVGYTTQGAGSNDAMVARLDSSGNLLWIVAVGGADNDYGFAITATSDGGMVIAGGSSSFDSAFGTSRAGFIFKLDVDGNFLWSKVIGGGADDMILGVQELSNGQLVFTGDSNGLSSGEGDVLVVRLSADGRVLEGCSSLVDVTPSITNITGDITFDWPSYTYAEVTPTAIYDWNITIRDVSSSFNQHSACESTPAPISPTAPTLAYSPTIAPIYTPTLPPTSPTGLPTQYPTRQPIPNPSATPSAAPTGHPTAVPTLPSMVPTQSPTKNIAPVIVNPIATQYATVGKVFEFFIPANTFFDGDGDELTISTALANGDPLPAWIHYVSSTEKLIGTPTSDDVTTLLVAITATDPQGASVSDLFSIIMHKVTGSPTQAPLSLTTITTTATELITSKEATSTLSSATQWDDASQQATTSSYSLADPMFILVLCLGVGLFISCGGCVLYCCYKNQKLERSLYHMDNSLKRGVRVPSITEIGRSSMQDDFGGQNKSQVTSEHRALQPLKDHTQTLEINEGNSMMRLSPIPQND